MGESVNPIEELIAKLRLLGQPSDAGDDSQEWTYRKCADLLEAATRPYRRVLGPPTEPGWYWIRYSYIDMGSEIIQRIAHLDDLEIQHMPFTVQWHARVTPPFGEVGE